MRFVDVYRAGVRFLMIVTCSVLGATPSPGQEYFAIHVLDSQTGRGVPLVQLIAQGGSPMITDSNGIAAFREPALMNKNVLFDAHTYGYAIGAQTLHTTPGVAATITINRQNLAERLYRVTGGGIYRDSVLVGASVPIDHPLLNANVIGQDSVQTVIYQDKIHWFWGDTFYGNGGFNFRSSGATSELPEQGGLDPSLGVNLNYFQAPGGNAAQMMPLQETGLVWLDGVFTVKDNTGQERMLARYERHVDLETIVETGLAMFDDTSQTFQRFHNYALGATLVPDGHSFRHTVDGEEFIYFALTYPNVRVKADWDHVTDITQWEAFTPLRENSSYDPVNPSLDLDHNGKPIFDWKKNTAPLSYEMLEDLVQRGHVAREQLPYRLEEFATGDDVRLHRSSVQWNEYRQAWIMIGVESFGDSFLGEVWFAEAPAPEGPWVRAVKVASHDSGSTGDYSFYNPSLHPYFDQEGGRLIYFEGTYSNTFSNNSNMTPLYDYNQMMYRLDLATIPDLFPRLAGDYDGSGTVGSEDYNLWKTYFGSTTMLAADGNGNGIVDAADYTIWRDNLGASFRSGVSLPSVAPLSATVPEPSGEIVGLGFFVSSFLARKSRMCR